MGRLGMAEKRRKPVTYRGSLRRVRCPILVRPGAFRRDFWPARSPHLALPPCLARVQGWLPESSPTTKTRLA